MTTTIEQYNVYPGLTPVRLVATANQSGTYFNGLLNNGVGATFTYAAGALTIDSVTVNVGDRVLFVAQSSASQNGVYVCNVAGSTGVQAVLQRAFDQQSQEQLKLGQYVTVSAGTANAGSAFVLCEPLPAQFGISNLVWTASPLNSNLGTAAPKAASDNAETTLASVAGDVTPVAGHIVVFDDANGTIVDSGISPTNPALTKAVMMSGSAVINDIAVFSDTSGTVADSTGVTAAAGNLQAGFSGTAGIVSSFPSTASKGKLILAAVNNTGNTNVTISNAAHGQASVYSIPDSGQATANFLMSDNATSQTINTGNLILGGTVLLRESVTDSISANTTQDQAHATALTTEVNRITVCANIGDGVKLPASAAGLTIFIINHGAKAARVYGNGADTIDDVAGATGILQMNGSVALYTCTTAGAWYSEGVGTGYSAQLQTLAYTDAITAHSGGGQGSAMVLVASLNRVSSAAAADSVALPVSAGGLVVTVINDTANSIQVFGQSPDTINGVATGTGVPQASKTAVNYYCTVGGNWITNTNLVAGGPAIAGTVASFPSSASNGQLILAAANNSGGNFNTTISNAASVGQSQVVSIPDGANAASNFIISNSSGTQHIATGNLSVDVGNLVAGSSGHAGTVGSFPSGATSGELLLAAVTNAGGNFNTTISNASSVAQSQVVSIPDGGVAASNFIISNNAGTQTIATGSLALTAGNVLANAGNLQAGSSGNAGFVSSFPGTASRGSLKLAAVNNTGNTITTISNAAMGQASVISIPDPAGATANFALAPAALVSGNLISASGTAGLIQDSGVVAANMQINTVNVSMNQAAVQGAFATPFQLIAAPGAGKVIWVLSANIYTNFQTSAFANGGVAIVQYDSTVHGAGTNALSATIPAAEITAAASQLYALTTSAATVLTGITNKGIFFSNATAAFTGGSASSTVVVNLNYVVLTATV